MKRECFDRATCAHDHADKAKKEILSVMGNVISDDSYIPASVRMEDGIVIGPRVVFSGGATIVRSGVTIEAAAVIGKDVALGQGVLVRAGAVVLQSVPPNAIVEGNPAQIVGYRELAPSGSGNIILRDASAFDAQDAPSKLELEAGDSALYQMVRMADPRGALTVGEIERDIPFSPKRYFMVFGVPTRELRGEHAHKECHQFLICAHGSCRVLLDDGERRCEVLLDRPNIGIHMPPMIWGTQYRYSSDAVLLVFASHLYDPQDYLRTYDDFLHEKMRGVS